MLTPLKLVAVRLLSSLKFWTMIIGLLATYLAKHGIIIDPAMANDIAIGFGLLLSAQALQDHGTGGQGSRATPPPMKTDVQASNDNAAPPVVAVAELEPKREAGFFRFDTACLVVFSGLILFALTMTACKAFSGKDAARAGAATAVDCGSKAALDVTKQFGPTLEQSLERAITSDGKIDRPSFADATKGFVTDTAWCVAENVVSGILAHVPLPGAPQASPLVLDAQDAQDALGAIRASRWPGKTFKPATAGQ